jgi:hypothetical protein
MPTSNCRSGFHKAAIAATAAVLVASQSWAAPGCHPQILRASKSFEVSVEACARRLEGKPFLDCVADAMARYSNGLKVNGADLAAPQGAPTAAKLVGDVKAAPSPAGAVSVLRNASSAVATLAASSQDVVKASYDRISAAFNRAAVVVGTKG